LEGDGHYDAGNDRWRLGFCTNDELVADLRTIGGRLGVSVRLRRHQHEFAGREFPGYRGEIRFTRSAHHNNRDDGEVIAIRESRARKFWDIGVSDEPHLFALASGVLTHNSKPNPMPESVTDRCVSAHEHIFMLTKRSRYYFDNDAIREPHTEGTHSRGGEKTNGRDALIKAGHWNTLPPTEHPAGRSCRNVWTIATAPYSAAHFATFPPELAERCIKAGTSERGCCAACRAPWVRQVEHKLVPGPKACLGPTVSDRAPNSDGMDQGTNRATDGHVKGLVSANTTTGWSLSCRCEAATVPCTVLDCFSGAGTALLVADRLGRDAIGIDLSHQYVEMTKERLTADCPLFMDIGPSPPPAEDPEDARMADLFSYATE
jgi:hypothetical protein